MKAMILSSGLGTRLKPLTDTNPKSLLELNSHSIIGIELEALLSCGIKDIIITTGYKHSRIEHFVTSNYPNLNISFVENESYETTNYIYSMWKTRNQIDDDILLMHGDMVFDMEVLRRLIEHSSPNGVLINRDIIPPEKDFKALVREDDVRKIGVDYKGPDAFFSAPIYKFSEPDFLKWMNVINNFVNEGNIRCYAEEALNTLLDELTLSAVYFKDEFCMEIDTFEDLEIAKEYFRKK